jgi:hypothetical protein
MKCFFHLLIFFGSTIAQAQLLPLGLYEGLMGNSGAATIHSTAASYYNPSLLKDRKDNAFSINGNTLGTSNTRDGDTTISSSLAVSPSYLSTIIVGEDLVHELFLATTWQGQFNWQIHRSDTVYDSEININRVISGYSMAFRSIPLALQVLARYSETKSFGISESSGPGAGVYSVSKIQTEYKNLNLALGVSSHFRFDHYTLGISFNTRGWTAYNQAEGSSKTFTHGLPNPGDYTVTENSSPRSIVSNEEGKLVIGHGFHIGNHEFLTDSVFLEPSNNLNRYDFKQTFGYRYGVADDHQLLCGVGHSFGSDAQYFGQSINVSAGYSWVSGKLRSAIGLYYSRAKADIETSAGGFLFGSEYEY